MMARTKRTSNLPPSEHAQYVARIIDNEATWSIHDLLATASKDTQHFEISERVHMESAAVSLAKVLGWAKGVA